jgi:hypothetical protein
MGLDARPESPNKNDDEILQVSCLKCNGRRFLKARARRHHKLDGFRPKPLRLDPMS